MSYLNKNAKVMIEEMKYYLGNVIEDDTAIGAYQHERGNKTCSSICRGGDVWSGNSTTWTGKIALMYPSDYAYTVNSSYWSTILGPNPSPEDTSWLHRQANHSTSGNGEWLVSPTSVNFYNASVWTGGGYLDGYDVYFSSVGVRPCLYLKSETKITDGDGSSTTPYFITMLLFTAPKTMKDDF